MCMYLFLQSPNEADLDEQGGHVSANWDVNSVYPDLAERERFSPPPRTITHNTHMQLN